jgi:hypothetical protein
MVVHVPPHLEPLGGNAFDLLGKQSGEDYDWFGHR